MSRLMISIHLPKTAGTSFGCYLKEAFKDKMIFVYPCAQCNAFVFDYNREAVLKRHTQACATHLLSLNDLSEFVKKNKIKCVHGHIDPIAIYPFFPKADYVVWLRDPVERLMSHFEFLKRNPTLTPAFARSSIGKSSLSEFVSIFPNHQAVCFKEFPLERFSFIGIVEREQEDMQRFCRQFKLRLARMPEENTNPAKGIGKYFLDSETRKMVENANAVDRQLYNKGLALRGKENRFGLRAYRFGAATKRSLKSLIKTIFRRSAFAKKK